MSGQIKETNPNNCHTCQRRLDAEIGSWCTAYTFSPTKPCTLHTNVFEVNRANRMLVGVNILEKMRDRHG